MKEVLQQCDLFRGMSDEAIAKVISVVRCESAGAGASLFRLGDTANSLFIVLAGCVELTVPISILGSMREVAVQTKGPGTALGWSAFVRPYRFRLSARVAEDCELAAIPRVEASRLFEGDHRTQLEFLRRIAEITAQRMLTVQALWVRELERSVRASSDVNARA